MELLATRTIDALGRVSLPLKARQELGWREKTRVDIYKLDENALVLRYNPAALSEKELAVIDAEMDGIEKELETIEKTIKQKSVEN